MNEKKSESTDNASFEADEKVSAPSDIKAASKIYTEIKAPEALRTKIAGTLHERNLFTAKKSFHVNATLIAACFALVLIGVSIFMNGYGSVGLYFDGAKIGEEEIEANTESLDYTETSPKSGKVVPYSNPEVMTAEKCVTLMFSSRDVAVISVSGGFLIEYSESDEAYIRHDGDFKFSGNRELAVCVTEESCIISVTGGTRADSYLVVFSEESGRFTISRAYNA